MISTGVRTAIKRGLGATRSRRTSDGLRLLIYHRVDGGTADERDLGLTDFRQQMDVLRDHDVVSLDEGLDRVRRGDQNPGIVLTFDDGFADVHITALPLLAERQLPFTLYLTTAFVGDRMQWDGSTATTPGPALTWSQLEELRDSGLCTIGNHTHTHARPEHLTVDELDRCTKEIEDRLGVTPTHFAYTWGVAVPAMQWALAERFRSAATGDVGVNAPGDDLLALRRIPVRGSDPLNFFAAKLTGRLLPERAYDRIVRTAKGAGLRG